MPKEKLFNTIYGELLEQTIIPENCSSNEYATMYQPLNILINKNMPKRLYRYRTCNENNFDAFQTNKIFFNTPNNFNDPHDCLVYFDDKKIIHELEPLSMDHYTKVFKEIITTKVIPDFMKRFLTDEIQDEALKAIEQSPEILAERVSEIPQNIDKILDYSKDEIHRACDITKKHIKFSSKIACFSRSINEPLMWSYYADSHKGFSLEYDLTKFRINCNYCEKKFICPQFVSCNIFPIVYTNKRYDATDLAIAMAKKRIFDQFGVINTNNVIPDRLAFKKANTYKGICWRHEKEWRMELICNKDNMQNWCEYKPEAIYLGCNISKVNRNILLKFANDNGIQTYQMDIQLSKLEFKMKYEKVKF